MNDKKLEEGFIVKDGDILVSLTMLENFANGMIDSLKTPYLLATSVKNMCEEMYIKAGIREETPEDGKDDGNPNNA